MDPSEPLTDSTTPRGKRPSATASDTTLDLLPHQGTVDTHWYSEAHRRLAEIRQGRVQPVPMNDVLRKLRKVCMNR